MATRQKLTEKQRRFVEAYMGEACGNATEAASLAGYKGNRNTLHGTGEQNLRKLTIRDAITERQKNEPLVASRKARMDFLAEISNDTEHHVRDRLRAVELLAKISGDFIERQIVDHRGKVQAELVESERTAFQKLLEDSTITEAIRTSLSLQDVPS